MLYLHYTLDPVDTGQLAAAAGVEDLLGVSDDREALDQSEVAIGVT